MKILTQPKLYTAIVLLVSSFNSTQAFAVEGLSANIAATNNYLWRGVSQSDGGSAISGGIDYASTSGFYIGTWASNIDFGDDTNYELDFYLGFGGEISNGFSYDVGYIYYAYPDAGFTVPGFDKTSLDYNFGEVYGSISYGVFKVAANIGVHNGDDAQWNDGALYLTGDANFEVAEGLALAIHLGNYSYDDSNSDYTEYSVSLSKNNFSFGIAANDIDGDDDVKIQVSYKVDIDL